MNEVLENEAEAERAWELQQSPDVGAEAHTRILGDVLRNQFDASTEPKELPRVVGIGGNERILHGKVALLLVVIRAPRIDTFRAVVDQREAECPGFLGGLRIADVFETGPVELGVGHHHFLGIELEESGRAHRALPIPRLRGAMA